MIKQKLNRLTSKTKLFVVVAITVLGNFFVLPLVHVFATTYTTKAQVILTNMNSSGTSSVILEFTPGSAAATLTLAFPSYTGSSNGIVNSTQTVSGSYNGSTCQSITGASAVVPGTSSATETTQTVTFTGVTAMTAGNSYCIVLSSTSAVTNPTATGQVAAVITAGTDAADTVETDIISNDQVIVTATVPPSFTMSMTGGGSDPFSPLSLSSSSIGATSGITVTVGTNAKNGWYLYASDSNSGLFSTTQSKTIASVAVGSGPTTISSGTEGYDLAVTTASITQGTGSGIGTTSAQTYYASTASGMGGGLNTVPRVIAQSTGTAVNATVPVKEYATISNITPAASDYSDTITLVGAGSF